MKKKKILFIIDGFNVGGAEIQLLNVLQHLGDQNFDFTVCSLRDTGPLKADYIKAGLRVLVIPRSHRADPMVFIELFTLIRKEKFDIVETILFYPDVAGAIVSRLAGVKVILSWAHASQHDTFFKPLHRRILFRLAMKFTSKIITVSREMKTSLVTMARISADKIDVIYNSIDLEAFTAKVTMPMKNFSDAEQVIGVVARLDYIKGHVYLVQALNLLKGKYPKLRCIFVGDGDYRKQIAREVKECDLDGVITLAGFRDDVAELLKSFDIFVLPSISEGLPNVILEAMASSLPIVASSIGGIPEVVRNNITGILVSPKDPASLAAALDSLLQDRSRCSAMGEQGRKRIEQAFSRGIQIEKFKRLYAQYS